MGIDTDGNPKEEPQIHPEVFLAALLVIVPQDAKDVRKDASEKADDTVK